MTRTKLAVVAAFVVLVATSCNYATMAQASKDRGDPVPWWCNPTDEVPVTAGPASGTVDWYAGTHKAPLTWEQCLSLSTTLDQAKAYAMQWPTAGPRRPTAGTCPPRTSPAWVPTTSRTR